MTPHIALTIGFYRRQLYRCQLVCFKDILTRKLTLAGNFACQCTCKMHGQWYFNKYLTLKFHEPNRQFQTKYIENTTTSSRQDECIYNIRDKG